MQKEKWRGHARNALSWSFYIVNDNNIVDGSKPQIMRCMICHVKFVPFNPRTKERRNYKLKKNGTTNLKKHVDANHVILAKRFKEEVNPPSRDVLEKQFAKKRPNVSNSKISKFFGAKNHFKKDFV